MIRLILRYILVVALGVGLGIVTSACTYHYTGKVTHRFLHELALVKTVHWQRNNTWVLSQQEAVCYHYFTEAPFLNKSITYDETLINRAFERSVKASFPLAQHVQGASSYRGTLQLAGQSGCSVLFYPSIFYIDDKVSSLEELDNASAELSQVGRDEVRLQVLIVDVRSRVLLDRALLNTKSSRLALREQRPDKLLSDVFVPYTRLLTSGSASNEL